MPPSRGHFYLEMTMRKRYHFCVQGFDRKRNIRVMRSGIVCVASKKLRNYAAFLEYLKNKAEFQGYEAAVLLSLTRI